MPGMSHFIMIEDPETFNRLLDETISEMTRKEEMSGEKKDEFEKTRDIKSEQTKVEISE